MELLIGIVGKPSSGKTTFLNAACLTSAKVGSYPFTTIKPNPGVAYVRSTCPSIELGLTPNPQNSFCINGLRFIPVDLLDVAGLVPGAWEGKGLGNQFLDDLCRADALIHVVDVSGSLDSTGHEVDTGTWDPSKDVEFLQHEISMWLLDIIKRDFRRIVGRVEAEKEDLSMIMAEKLSGLAITRNQVSLSIQKSGLDKKKPSQWSDQDILQFTKVLQKIAKPMIIAANKIDRPAAKEWLKSLEKES
ncbi:MAG: GTPase, partial [Candidatus Hodarchaeota archaeon]